MTTLVPVAVNETVPALTEVALTVLIPAAGPKVSDVLANPFASVVAVIGDTAPPPPVTAKVTTAPATAKLLLFLICTTNGFVTLVLTVALCASPLTLEIANVTTGIPVAVNVTAPAPLAVAEALLTPAIAPKVNVVRANPLASVNAEIGVVLPPPPVTAKLTSTPGTATLLLFLT